MVSFRFCAREAPRFPAPIGAVENVVCLRVINVITCVIALTCGVGRQRDWRDLCVITWGGPNVRDYLTCGFEKNVTSA